MLRADAEGKMRKWGIKKHASKTNCLGIIFPRCAEDEDGDGVRVPSSCAF